MQVGAWVRAERRVCYFATFHQLLSWLSTWLSMSKLSKLRAAVMTLFRDRRNKRDRSLEIGSVSLPRVVFSCRTHEYFFATVPRAAWLLGTKGHA